MMHRGILLLLAWLTMASAETYHPEEPPQVTFPRCEPSAMDPDADCIFGTAGNDYPILARIPDTGFPCRDHLPGIYGDTEASCQVYHMCLHGGSKHSFLCPNGTLFNQAYFVCDLWFNVECSRTPEFYVLNENIYKGPDDVGEGGSYT